MTSLVVLVSFADGQTMSCDENTSELIVSWNVAEEEVTMDSPVYAWEVTDTKNDNDVIEEGTLQPGDEVHQCVPKSDDPCLAFRVVGLAAATRAGIGADAGLYEVSFDSVIYNLFDASSGDDMESKLVGKVSYIGKNCQAIDICPTKKDGSAKGVALS